MGKLASALKPAMQAYEVLVEDEQFKVRSLMKNFIRFYAYMAQVVRTFDRELYKTYIFAEFFYRVIPKKAYEKVDLTNKLALINNKLTETFSGAIELRPSEKDKMVNPEKGTQGKKPEEKTDLLANIIEKINIMYAGKFTEADRVIVETIYDKMVKSGKALKKQAKNNDAQMFETSIFPKEFDKVAQKCYMEQMDAFSKLFEDEQFYKRVMSEMAKAMYLNYRNSALGEKTDTNILPLHTNSVSYLQDDDDEESLMMAAEDYECYQWNRDDESIMNLFGDNKTILLGCYKNKKHFEWINEKGIYNIRLGRRKGAMENEKALFEKTAHLVLYDVDHRNLIQLYDITSNCEMSGQQLMEINYPNRLAGKKYMTFKIEKSSLDSSNLKDIRLIERIMDSHPEHVKGKPVFIEP